MTEASPALGDDDRRLLWPVAAVAIAIAAVLAAWGTFGGGDDAGEDLGEYVVVLAIIVVAAAIVFGWVVRRTFPSGAFGRNGLILGVLGLLSVAAFWSGLPPILGLGGAYLGWVGRRRGEGGLATGALVIGFLALVADLAIYIQDQA